jgi:glucose/arabinose dehydrogenase/N-acetylneuraminic acid mutarotase
MKFGAKTARRRSRRALLGAGVAALAVLSGLALVAAGESAYSMQVSSSPTRSAPTILDGGTVSGTIYAFLTPESGVRRVRFYLDDPTMSGSPRLLEGKKPWDFAGTKGDGTALPFDTATVADGTHRITASIDLTSGVTEVTTATFTVANSVAALSFTPSSLSYVVTEGESALPQSTNLAASNGAASPFRVTDDAEWLAVTPSSGTTPATLSVDVDPSSLVPGTYTATATASADASLSSTLSVTLTVTSASSTHRLDLSASPDRSSPSTLDGATLAGNAYVFVAPESGVSQVKFFLDDPAMSGTPRQVEKNAPWDFAGGTSTGQARPFDTKTVPDGSHSITAAITLPDGGAEVIHSSFEVLNAPPALVFGADSLAFDVEEGGISATDSVALGSDRSTSPTFSLSKDAPWLMLTADSTTVPATVTVTANPGGLVPGVYTATVTATAADHTSDSLAVSMTVGETDGCEPLACSQIRVGAPYDLDWTYDHSKILDSKGLGTGFTYVDPPSNGTGYLRENLNIDLDAATLDITTTAGLASGQSNSLDNALGVGINAASQVTLLSTTLGPVPAGTGKFEQAGLWLGNDEDNYVKVMVYSTSRGTRIQYLLENGGVHTARTNRAPGGLVGSNVTFNLKADPATRTIKASFAVNGGTEETIDTFTVPGEFFSFDAAGIDPRIGTRTFGGIFASHRDATKPLVYRFSEFSMKEAPVALPAGELNFTRSSVPVPIPTSMVWGPDGRLYVTELFGTIHALSLDANKALVSDEVITTLGSRLTLGITVDPDSTPENVILWVASSDPSVNSGEENSSAVTRLSGAGFAQKDDVITGLPRAIANHAINSIHFGPDGKLYIAAGGNTGAGAANEANTEFGDRAEQPLSAAILVADVKGATFDGSCANTTDIYGPAPCDVVPHATGFRNTYDMVFHSNGSLYAADNGLGVVGTYPPSPTPPCDGFGDPARYDKGGNNPGEQPDLLQRVEPGKYYGHPNQSRDECVFFDGSYQGVAPLPNFVPAMHVLGKNKSANGIIEYAGDSFCGALKGDLLIANYSVGDDITRVQLSDDGLSVVSAGSLIGDLNDPLPLTQGPDGTIYVGEFGGSQVTALVPNETGCWSTKAPLPQELLDAGGTDLDGKLYVVGGKTDSAHRSTLYVYDPSTDTWTTGPDLPGPGVENPAVAASNGKLYVFGGSTAPFSGALTDAAVFDPTTSSWKSLAPSPTARGGATARAVGGRIYLVGGLGADGGSLASMDVYDPATDTWTAGASMQVRRDNPASAVLDGKLYVFGGRTRNADGTTVEGRLASVEMYDPATGTWSSKAPMPTGRRTAVVGTAGGRAQVIGGEGAGDGSAFAQHEEYDPVTDTWRVLPKMPTPRHGAVAGTIDGMVHVVAGGPTGGSAFTSVHEVFSFLDPLP